MTLEYWGGALSRATLGCQVGCPAMDDKDLRSSFVLNQIIIDDSLVARRGDGKQKRLAQIGEVELSIRWERLGQLEAHQRP